VHPAPADRGAAIPPGELTTCRRPNPEARLRLYCFPFAGAGSWQLFDSWADDLPGDIRRDVEIWTVDVRGGEGSRATRLPELLSDVFVPLTSQLVAPYVFYGHSMGALVCFEYARRLHSEGLPDPEHLIVGGHRGPRLPYRRPPVHELPDHVVLDRLATLDGTPEEVLRDPEVMALFLPRLRADLAICETYAYGPGPPLPCSLTAFGGHQDPDVSREDILAWRAETGASFSAHMFPGGHFFPQQARTLVLDIVARDLRRVLRRIPADRP
jgi:medium-chain acyl-[acyl-carrier-protein] hydrolase